jgi:hypothetical protein
MMEKDLSSRGNLEGRSQRQMLQSRAEWFVLIDGKHRGPMSLEAAFQISEERQHYQQKVLFWREDLLSWFDRQELNEYLEKNSAAEQAMEAQREAAYQQQQKMQELEQMLREREEELKQEKRRPPPLPIKVKEHRSRVEEEIKGHPLKAEATEAKVEESPFGEHIRWKKQATTLLDIGIETAPSASAEKLSGEEKQWSKNIREWGKEAFFLLIKLISWPIFLFCGLAGVLYVIDDASYALRTRFLQYQGLHPLTESSLLQSGPKEYLPFIENYFADLPLLKNELSEKGLLPKGKSVLIVPSIESEGLWLLSPFLKGSVELRLTAKEGPSQQKNPIDLRFDVEDHLGFIGSMNLPAAAMISSGVYELRGQVQEQSSWLALGTWLQQFEFLNFTQKWFRPRVYRFQSDSYAIVRGRLQDYRQKLISSKQVEMSDELGPWKEMKEMSDTYRSLLAGISAIHEERGAQLRYGTSILAFKNIYMRQFSPMIQNMIVDQTKKSEEVIKTPLATQKDIQSGFLSLHKWGVKLSAHCADLFNDYLKYSQISPTVSQQLYQRYLKVFAELKVELQQTDQYIEQNVDKMKQKEQELRAQVERELVIGRL